MCVCVCVCVALFFLIRSNDSGDLVVTKGDQYDVREAGSEEGKGDVRNLGKPVDLSGRYRTSVPGTVPREIIQKRSLFFLTKRNQTTQFYLWKKSP